LRHTKACLHNPYIVQHHHQLQVNRVTEGRSTESECYSYTFQGN
jgi:hypothetical protein